MAGTYSLKLAQRGCRLGDSLRGAAGEWSVPLRDRVGHERLEAERLTVAPRSVAAPFPEAVDKLGQRSSPFGTRFPTKGTFMILS